MSKLLYPQSATRPEPKPPRKIFQHQTMGRPNLKLALGSFDRFHEAELLSIVRVGLGPMGQSRYVITYEHTETVDFEEYT